MTTKTPPACQRCKVRPARYHVSYAFNNGRSGDADLCADCTFTAKMIAAMFRISKLELPE